MKAHMMPILALSALLAQLLVAHAAADDAKTPSSTEATPNAAELAARDKRAFIAHVPRGSAKRESIRLSFDVRGDDLAGEIVVYFRPLQAGVGEVQVMSTKVSRDAEGYHATISASQAAEPGIAYWVVERLPDGSERAVFGSATEPQPLHIQVDPSDSREARLLHLAHGQRSRIAFRGEWVSLGDFDVANTSADDEHDRYYHLEARYAYRFYRSIEELEFALGSLRGDVLDQATLDARREVGLDYGRAAITFALGDFFRLRPGVLLGVSTEGFEGGFDLAALLGDRDGTELSFKGGYVSGLGGHFGTRLGWATVPRVPMGASVEITNFPTAEDLGVRMLFDIGYALTDAALLSISGGYRGRTSLAGGPSLSAELSYGF